MESSSLTPQQIADRANQVAQFIQSPGWALLRASLMPTVAAAKGAARNAATPQQMGLHLGTALALEEVLAWPERELSMARALLQDAGQAP